VAFKTIAIVGTPQIKEYTANAAATPGHLCELMSTGKVRAHATAGGSCQKRFFLENKLAGGEIDTAYVADEQCQTGVFKPGDEVYGLLADGENAAIGSKLESAGDGTLRVVHVDASVDEIAVNSIVGEALEAVNMTGRIRFEVW